MKKFYLVFGLLMMGAGSLAAGVVSYTGTFTTDDQTESFDLDLTANSTVTFETLSYAGGTNSANVVIPAGGFDPRLTWYGSDGTQIGSDNGGHCGNTASYLGACNDAYFSGFLPAGDYTIVLSQDGNDPNGELTDGFSETGNPNFTADGPCSMFCDSLSGDQLTGNYDVEIGFTPVNPPAAPEPSTFVLSAGVLAFGFTIMRRYRRA